MQSFNVDMSDEAKSDLINITEYLMMLYFK